MPTDKPQGSLAAKWLTFWAFMAVSIALIRQLPAPGWTQVVLIVIANLIVSSIVWRWAYGSEPSNEVTVRAWSDPKEAPPRAAQAARPAQPARPAQSRPSRPRRG
jgi:hypothetical protein